MIVFNLFQHLTVSDGGGNYAGTFSSFLLAKHAAGGEEAMRAHWKLSSIDTQSEPEAWEWKEWSIMMVEVDVSCDGVRCVLKTDVVSF